MSPKNKVRPCHPRCHHCHHQQHHRIDITVTCITDTNTAVIVYVFAKQTNKQNQQRASRGMTGTPSVPNKCQLSPPLPRAPSILYKLVPVYLTPGRGPCFGLEQSVWRKCCLPRARGSVCAQSPPANFLSLQWYLIIHFLLKARCAPVSPHLPLLASACCGDHRQIPMSGNRAQKKPSNTCMCDVKSSVHTLAITLPS